MGGMASGRRGHGEGESFELREIPISYMDCFEAEKSEIDVINSYFWTESDINTIV